MELDNQSTKKAYIQLMTDVLEKKAGVLNQLMLLTEQQEILIASDNFDEDEFLQIVSTKDEMLQNLNKLDDGFEQLYDRVREEIVTEKDKYTTEIKYMQKLIATITDINVKLQASEKRNKSKLELYFSNRRNQIKSSRVNNQSVTNYYKTMTKQHDVQSFFYDKKN